MHVVELHELDRRVHVAQGDRHERRRHARAGEVDGVGVGAGGARGGLDGERDLLLGGGVVEQLEQPRVDASSRG